MARTARLRADSPEDIRRCAAILKRGGLVAFPTETVYGLGANALSADAVRRIFVAKARPSWDPLIVHLASSDQVSEITHIEGELARRAAVLAEHFWPGPLTLLLPRRNAIPDEVTAGRPSVGVRVPAHPAARALLRAAGLPLAAPSANRFGHISPTTAEHVLDDLDGRIDAVLDGGPCTVGVESTVLDPSLTPMRIYRAGALTAVTLSAVTGVGVQAWEPSAVSAHDLPQALPSPGVGLRHYAPRVKLRLCAWSAVDLAAQTTRLLQEQGGKAGVMLPAGWELPLQNDRLLIRVWGNRDGERSLAQDLFAALRELEGQVDTILCPLPERSTFSGDLLEALRDRLTKAAKPR